MLAFSRPSSMRVAGDVDGLHAEGGDRDDGDDREHERQNQPLMLAEDEQVIPEMRLTRRQVPAGRIADER